ncbi:4'-phosphopantetheinyl transferase family protein [Rhodalgimonas zhirmunskyi]|uniref:Enterobactin synthase component D n=1 Tax=Rhodalgimonas zhirmunskyi TaxID=2964767 RepID=A0AAJ1U8M2_9RHOB|nr:4'-phosphopantetheinyl transferase superfamily protein [Rhodoalgimonas zhirmunskyi]MDQ2093163.1 4'-phosphopantetheinyl transferase superfamily protein [Rhodoalgimonas zhirmunskyi]
MARDLTPLAALGLALSEVLPEGVTFAVEDPSQPEGKDDLFASEAAAMTRAVPVRRAEFAAGRRAAHRAMDDLGVLPAPVPMAADRAPEWPEGLVGSISHCEGAAVAVLGFSGVHAALAVDVEPDLGLPRDLHDLVCTEAERAWLSGLEPGARDRAARKLFSAKECVYKLQFAQGGKLLNFSDVEVVIDVDHGAFEARFLCDAGRYGAQEVVQGRCLAVGGFIICFMSALQDIEIVA